jgi:OFA family oxalate/formate antiporter-like MFS transporter
MMFGLSAAIMSPVFAYMLESMGYVSTNIAVAIGILVVGVAAGQFTESPERLIDQGFPAEASEKSRGPSGDSLVIWKNVRTRSFWFLWLPWAFQGAAGIAMVSLSTAFGLSRGFGMESAVFILTMFNLINGSSRLLMGYLSDVVGRNVTMSVAFFAAGCAYFVLPHVGSVGVSAALAAIVGLAFGTLFAVSAPLTAECFGLENFGVILGLVFTAYGFISGAIGPSLSGYILDVTQENFTIVFTYLGIFCLLSGILIRFVHPLHDDQ